MKTVKLTDEDLDLLYEVLDDSIDDAYNCMYDNDTENEEFNTEITEYIEKIKSLMGKFGFKE